ncbi:MAG: hypothetical protein ACRDBH_02915 [Bosea sp. (in: a-proteobacteria)]
MPTTENILGTEQGTLITHALNYCQCCRTIALYGNQCLILGDTNKLNYPSIYLLMGFSIELGLKSYLINCGIAKNILNNKNNRHDLSFLLNKSKEFGIDLRLNDGVEYIVQSLTESHKKHVFRYGSENFNPPTDTNTQNLLGSIHYVELLLYTVCFHIGILTNAELVSQVQKLLKTTELAQNP